MNCEVCQKVLVLSQKRVCSWSCRARIKKGICWNKGKNKLIDSRLSGGAPKGGVPWNKNKTGLEIGPKGIKWSKDRKQEWSISRRNAYRSGKLIPWNKKWFGERNPVDIIRKSPEYKAFRRSMFERDNFTCHLCGQRGGELQLDHILPTCLYLHLIMDENNVRTLCVPCHQGTPTFGRSPKRSLVNTNAA